MTNKDLAEAMGKPQTLRLKQIGAGIMVGKVLGSRVLVKTVAPRTDLDRVEEQGLISIPKWVKKENTPLPTTGIVLQVGPDVPCESCGTGRANHMQGDCITGPEGGRYSPLVNEGDMIMFPKFAGSDFRIEEKDLRILEVREILCTLVDTQEALHAEQET